MKIDYHATNNFKDKKNKFVASFNNHSSI